MSASRGKRVEGKRGRLQRQLSAGANQVPRAELQQQQHPCNCKSRQGEASRGKSSPATNLLPALHTHTVTAGSLRTPQSASKGSKLLMFFVEPKTALELLIKYFDSQALMHTSICSQIQKNHSQFSFSIFLFLPSDDSDKCYFLQVFYGSKSRDYRLILSSAIVYDI